MFSLVKFFVDLLLFNEDSGQHIANTRVVETKETLFESTEESRSVVSYITLVSGDEGLLDNDIYFNFNCIVGRNRPKLGDQVNAVIKRRSPNAGWCATQLCAYDDNTIWNSTICREQHFTHVKQTEKLTTHCNKNTFTQENDVNVISKDHNLMFGCVTHMLCSSERGSIKTIPTDDIFEFALSDCTDWYTPNQGDSVKFKVGHRSDFIIAVNISPTRVYRFDGRVRAVKGNHGYIEGDIFFTHSVCVDDVMPAKLAQVSGIAVERLFGSCMWRAISVKTATYSIDSMRSLNKHHQSNAKQHGHGIIISNDFTTDPIIETGQKTEITVSVTNHGARLHKLTNVTLDDKLTNVTLDEQSSEPSQCFSVKKIILSTDSAALNEINRELRRLDVKVLLHPGTSLRVICQCQPITAGKVMTDMTFDFDGLSISHSLSVMAIDPVYRHLVPVTSLKHRANSTSGQRHYTSQRGTNGWMVPGEKPKGFPSKATLPYDLPIYTVPEFMYDAMTDSAELTRVQPHLLQPLDMENYKNKMRCLLYLEEIQGQLEMAEFDMERCIMRVCGPYIGLRVEGLSEGRPSLLIGDKIVVAEPGCEDGPCFEGYVHEVLAEEILIKFNISFHQNFDGKDYNVKFLFNRTSIRRCQQAINLAYDLGQAVLFPATFKAREPQWKSTVHENWEKHQTTDERPMKFINTSLNERQKCAVSRILLGQSRPTPYIIYGPPGTGKTVTLVEAILQIFTQIPSSRILTCSPSNNSADLIAERLHESGWVTTSDMVRINAMQRNIKAVSEKILPYCSTEELRVASIYRVIVCTCSTAGMLYPLGIRPGHFTHVFVDEAGQATEPECFIALCLASGAHSQLVLCGDPMQLGPVLRSREAKGYGLQESYLERLTCLPIYRRNDTAYPGDGYNPHLVTKLLVSYRTHATLLKLPSLLFYHDELTTMADPAITNCLISWDKLPNKNGVPLLFHGVVGEDAREGNSPSWFNPAEVVVVVQYLQSLLSTPVYPLTVGDIAVITPYRKQVEKIRLLIDKLNIGSVKVGSVEEFQGQERKVVIISTVRSNSRLIEFDQVHNLGFLTNPKRFNVAISRVQACLVVVGDPHVLSQDEYWYTLIDYCNHHGAYLGCDLPSIFTNNTVLCHSATGNSSLITKHTPS